MLFFIGYSSTVQIKFKNFTKADVLDRISPNFPSDHFPSTEQIEIVSLQKSKAGLVSVIHYTYIQSQKTEC